MQPLALEPLLPFSDEPFTNAAATVPGIDDQLLDRAAAFAPKSVVDERTEQEADYLAIRDGDKGTVSLPYLIRVERAGLL